MPKDRGAAYWRNRIERDHPEIAAQLKDGSLPSVRAACIAAGLIQQPSGLDELTRAWSRASEEDRQIFLGAHASTSRPPNLIELLHRLHPDVKEAQDRIDGLREAFGDAIGFWGVDEDDGFEKHPTQEQAEIISILEQMVDEGKDPWPGLTGEMLRNEMIRAGLDVGDLFPPFLTPEKFESECKIFESEYMDAGVLTNQQKRAIRWHLRTIRRQVDITPGGNLE